jgi:hypothetical protein
LIDPWLTENALAVQLTDTIFKENEFQEKMLHSCLATKENERLLLSALKQVIEEYLDLSLKFLYSNKELFESLRATVASYDTTWSFDAFTASHHILGTPVWHTKRSKDSFAYRTPDTESLVVKDGELLRPGTIRKSKWKESRVVLTRLGFLHCFEDPAEQSKILFSISLRNGKSSVEPVSDHCFEITVNPVKETGFFKMNKKEAKHLFNCSSEAINREWVTEIKKVIEKNRKSGAVEPLSNVPAVSQIESTNVQMSSIDTRTIDNSDTTTIANSITPLAEKSKESNEHF